VSLLGSPCQELTRRLRPGSLDLLVLPEMALSGYVFSNPTSILPYLENPKTGPTATLAKSLAKRIGCHVIAGYPEALEYAQSASTPTVEPTQTSSSSSSGAGADPDLSPAYQLEGSGHSQRSGSGSGSGINQDSGPSSMKALEGEALGVGYNSAVVVSPEGEVVGNYRKTFRFETDKNWAREGESADTT
jgi:protein N-terminal amidase